MIKAEDFPFRIFKYLLNIAGMLFLFYATWGSFAIIVQFPSKIQGMRVIWETLKFLITLYLAFFLLTVPLNYFVERKLEKKASSKEFLVLVVSELLLISMIAIFFSIMFYNQCS